MTVDLKDRGHHTALVKKNTWRANAAANKPRIRYQVNQLWKDGNERLGILIAAGPSLPESIAELKELDRKKCEVVVVDMALQYLLVEGIIPNYVICTDDSVDIQRTLDVDLPGMGVPLLLNVVAHPTTATKWKGPIYWFCMASNYYDIDASRWMQQDQQWESGVSSFLVPGGNVSSMGLSFLASVRACRKVMLYGHDFCWQKGKDFYAGGVQQELVKKRMDAEERSGSIFAVKDVRGNGVLTNGSLMEFASWYTGVSRAMPGLMVNRTPDTILRLEEPES